MYFVPLRDDEGPTWVASCTMARRAGISSLGGRARSRTLTGSGPITSRAIGGARRRGVGAGVDAVERVDDSTDLA